MTQRDTLYRIGLAFMGFVSLALGYFWWKGLVHHMAPQHAADLKFRLMIAGIIFVPLGLFLWLMAKLIRPNK